MGHLHFITCSCYRRLPLFSTARAKNLFVKVLGEVRDRHGFALAGNVVMPNHIHLLIGEPAKGTPSTVMQVLKQRVSRRLRRKPRKNMYSQQLRLPFRGAQDMLPQFWQPRFYDFTGAGSTWSPPEKRLEPDEIYRKTSLHAHESGEAAPGVASEGLALEQFFILREKGGWTGSHRSYALMQELGIKSKAPPLKNVKDGPPYKPNAKALPPARKFKAVSKGAPPASALFKGGLLV
jgi:REP element-mobilizing transposase RayT